MVYTNWQQQVPLHHPATPTANTGLTSHGASLQLTSYLGPLHASLCTQETSQEIEKKSTGLILLDISL